MSVYFTDGELDVLMEAAELLMPDERLLPSVASAGLRERYLDEAVVARPETPPLLKEFARQARAAGTTVALGHIESSAPEVWEAVTTILPGAYFLSPAVRDALDYRGQVADPIVIAARPDYADLIGPVVDRGPVYRPTPHDPAPGG